MKKPAYAKGFTLVEVLIALVVLAIGLLGMASLMMNSLQSSQGAYLRSQASLLTYDIVERMRANRGQATSSDAYTLTENAAATSDPGCKNSGCSSTAQAQLDLHEWRTALEEGIPGATATIGRANGNEYTIKILWEESSAPQTPEGPSFELRIDL